MQNSKLSDYVVDLLIKHNILQVFGIIGSANAHLFDSIYQNKKINLTCMHHEQACVMAAHGYFMESGKVAAVLVTAGAGTTNLLTGVVGAWADSVPVLILSGQESTKQFINKNITRMIGIQGVFTPEIFKTCTKRAITCHSIEETISEVEAGIILIKTPRYGPCIIDIPIDLQGQKITSDLFKSSFSKSTRSSVIQNNIDENKIKEIISNLKKSTRPLLWIGNGLRGLNKDLLSSMLREINIPYLTSWTANDIVEHSEGIHVGHAGTYGSRVGNIMLQSCDLLITIGTRLAIPQKGYVDQEFARDALIYVVDIDQNELNKLGDKFNRKINCDAKSFFSSFYEKVKSENFKFDFWLKHLKLLKNEFPLLEKFHIDQKGDLVNAYYFISELGKKAKKNTTFVTDMGTALITAFQVLEPKNGQHLFTSQGLGEMGYGLPGSIGAWFSNPSREIICLNCDGGIMMNLQDLQTVIHNEIPMKIIIFNNDGYLMIKHTQDAILKGRRAGTDRNSGLTCPNYEKIANAFGFQYMSIKDDSDIEQKLKLFINCKNAIIFEVFMKTNQPLVPKLSVSISNSGKLLSPPLEDLKPFISLEKLEEYLLTDIFPSSREINRQT
ncbi:thiamine pyrophosphate-binding protein [Prochlorococcus sp. AH-716-M10]|nr:thiamine pyrophosphate-binding protein [Prochlorococcus sp. AH-716-M10]